jgi:hypothetical protein
MAEMINWCTVREDKVRFGSSAQFWSMWKHEMLSLWRHIVDHYKTIHAPAAIKKKKVDKKRAKVRYAFNQRQGKRYLRGERNMVVDGYPAVEHERCFCMRRVNLLSLGVNNGIAVRTNELAVGIDIGILVGGR